MSNLMKCQDCPATLNRGHMHIRSISFRQVGWCPECWEIHQRLDRIVQAVRDGIPTAAA